MEDKEQFIDAQKEVGLLIVTILQPAIAGGMPEKKAKRMFNEIMDSISALHSSHNQFNTLLEDIINKLAIPIIARSGIKIDIMDTGSQQN